MRCESCGRSAPTKQVKFYQQIGLVIMRLEGEVDGDFCKSCIHRVFFQTTMICMVAGWWGVISFFMNIFYLFHNFLEWIFCLGMRSRHAEAAGPESTPQLNDTAESVLMRFAKEIQTRLRRGDTVAATSLAIAQSANVPREQVLHFIRKHYAKLK